MKLKNLNKLH